MSPCLSANKETDNCEAEEILGVTTEAILDVQQGSLILSKASNVPGCQRRHTARESFPALQGASGQC